MSDPETPRPPADSGDNTAPAKRKRRRSGRPNRAAVDFSAPRHQARILAMQALFEIDQTDHDVEEILARIETPALVPAIDAETGAPADVEETEETDTEFVPPPVAKRAVRLVRGVLEHMPTLDPYIEKAAPQFPIRQLASIDRCVLRIAVYELVVTKDEVPFKVAINEAVEIAKRYGGERSGAFVNGVLGTIAKAVQSADGAETGGR